MEVEARFAIPDQVTYERLRSLDHLDRFSLQQCETVQIEDVYLDTEDRRIARAGYACCLRRRDGAYQVLIRKRETPEPPLHRYARLQTALSGNLPLNLWPAGPVRDEVEALVEGSALREVLALQRTQERRCVCRDQRVVAELKQDIVWQRVAGEQQEFLDLVIRLNEEGTEEELSALVAGIRRMFDLRPQPVSRYQRGVSITGESPTESPLLTREEYRSLQRIAGAQKRYARRACALIALHHGATQLEAGAYAGLTDRRVRYWLAQFRERRLDIFPQHLLGAQRSPPQSIVMPEAVPPAVEGPSGLSPDWDIASDSPVLQDTDPGLQPDDTMTEAARKTLRYHFQEMLSREAGTRQGEDPEELHKMRVATRRMRAAERVFRKYIKNKYMKPHLDLIRRTARVLGRVRDLDVAQEKADDYVAANGGQTVSLGPLLSSWGTAHDDARADLIAYLDGDGFRHFKTAFADYLDHPLPKPKCLCREDKVVPESLRYVVPIEVYRRLAEMRVYDAIVTSPEVELEDYHNLRIAAKRLRYTLEFFAEILGPEASLAIDDLKRLQDYLGDLQDAVVASDRLRNFWLWGSWDPPAEDKLLATRVRPILAPGVARYHAEKQIEIQEALDGFQDIWSAFQAPTFGEMIAKAVSIL